MTIPTKEGASPRYSKYAYEDVARVIREVTPQIFTILGNQPETDEIIELLAARFAMLFSLDSPFRGPYRGGGFDGSKFTDACRGRGRWRR